jgi:predicted DNA-binding transcriptional regulator AlpA
LTVRLAIEPRGLQREVAARYIGVSPNMLDAMIADGRMPKPRLIGRRKVWDRQALDSAFDALPAEPEVNPWDRHFDDAN